MCRREQDKPDTLVSLQEHVSIEAEDATLASETLRGVDVKPHEVKPSDRKGPRDKPNDKRRTSHSKDVDAGRGVAYHNNDQHQ